MANDIFTGGASGDPIDWSAGIWSGDNPPTATDTVEEQGAGVDNVGGDTLGSLTVGGLVLDSGASLTVDAGLIVSGLTDTTFGGVSSTLTVGEFSELTVDSSVTSALGTVKVDDDGIYQFEGSGATQTVFAGDNGAQGAWFLLGGSHNDFTVTLQPSGFYDDGGTDNGGTVHLEGGLFEENGTGATTTVDMTGGGAFNSTTPFGGLIEDFGGNGALVVGDATLGSSGLQFIGTPSTYSVDTSGHTMTFNFTTSTGTESQTLDFNATSDITNIYVVETSTQFQVLPLDVFTGATGGGSNTWSTTSDWSTGATPSQYAVVEQTGAGTLNVPSGGGTEQLTNLILATGALLTIPTGVTLETSGSVAGSAYGGAGSTIDVAGTLTIGLDVTSAAGAIDLSGGTYSFEGAGSTQTVDMSGGGTFNVEAAFGGQITHLNTAGQVVVSNSGGAERDAINSNNTVTLNFGGGVTYTLAFDSTVGLSVAINYTNGDFVITSAAPVCFTSGTRIETMRGEVAVEDLNIGDLVVTATGEARPIVWIGHKRIALPTPAEQPIRVRAGAFGEGAPARDLRLSPGHAVCVNLLGEVFTPVSGLINGVTILAEVVAEVTYWHVELESHDVLLAEGLPCESYMDTGNRAFFGREYGRLQAIDLDRIAASLTRYARPFVNDEATVTAIRQRLAARAARVTSESAEAA